MGDLSIMNDNAKDDLLENFDPDIKRQFSRKSLHLLNYFCLKSELKCIDQNKKNKNEILNDILELQMKLYELKRRIYGSEEMRMSYIGIAKEGQYSCWDEVTLTEAHLINLQKEYSRIESDYKFKEVLYYRPKKSEGYITKTCKTLMRKGLKSNMNLIEDLNKEK